MVNLQSAASLHLEYRMMADNTTQVFSELMTAFPMQSFPKHAARVWRYAALAEMWGAVATQLSPSKKNYLDEWRTGK